MVITIQSKNVEKRLRDISNGIAQELPKFISEAGSLVATDITGRFRDETDVNGKVYKPLAQSTKREKQKKGYGSKPILERNGTLRRSTKKSLTTQEKVEVTNNVKYAKYHQYGTKRTQYRFKNIGRSRSSKISKGLAESLSKNIFTQSLVNNKKVRGIPQRKFFGITRKAMSMITGLLQKLVLKIVSK